MNVFNARAPRSSARSPSRSTAPRCSPASRRRSSRTGIAGRAARRPAPARRPRWLDPAAGRRAEPVRSSSPDGPHLEALPLPRRLRHAGQLDLHARRQPARRPPSRRCAGDARCVPQPGTATTLDGSATGCMFRLAYRRFGDGHESLVGNLTVELRRRRRVSAGSRSRNATSGPPRVRPAEHLPARHDLALDGQRRDGYARQHRARLQRLEREHPSADPLRRPARWRPGQHACAGRGDAVRGHRAARPARATAGATTATASPSTRSDDCTFWYTSEYFTSQSDGSASSPVWSTRIGYVQASPPSCGDRAASRRHRHRLRLRLRPATSAAASARSDADRDQGRSRARAPSRARRPASAAAARAWRPS